MSAGQGIRQALKEYGSDKVKDRVAGGERLKEMLGNRENLNVWQVAAAKEGGALWLWLLEILFGVVAIEKKAVMKKNAAAQAEKRLSDAISLVRWITDRSVHLLPRRPLLALVRHMTSYLVQNSALFIPAVRDYAKALRTVLSYPPHLENIEEHDWKRLMSICWAGALNDRIVREEQWNDEGYDELEETQEGGGDGDDDMIGTPSYSSRPKPVPIITQGVIELLNLIPILLSSPSAPILPLYPAKPPPGVDPVRTTLPASVGYSILVKTIRFLEQHPNETSAHLPVLRSCNIILVELELNSRDEVTKAGAKLLPPLAGLWSTRNRPLREQLLIALRLLLPWLTHEAVEGSTKEAVQEGFGRLVDAMAKESSSRWGIEPLDLHHLRIAIEQSSDEAFHLDLLRPGFDFTHEMAFAWTVQQLYADMIVYLYKGQSIAGEASDYAATATGRSSKRRRVENPLITLLDGIGSGSSAQQLLSIQVLIFILSNHHSSIRPADHSLIRSAVLDCMEADDENLQSWTFICLPVIQSGIGLGADGGKVWASSTRKVALSSTSRAAAFCATTLLRASVVGSDILYRDIGNLLRQIDIQGPPHPYDSVCRFLATILELAQSDVRLYSQNLEDKVLAWLARHDLVDGPRGRTRMDARSVSDVLRLLCTAAGLSAPPIESESPIGPSLPECPIVERVLAELHVQPVRLFVLYGEFPKSDRHPSTSTPSTSVRDGLAMLSGATAQSDTLGSDTFLSDRQRRITEWLRSQIKRDLADWQSQSTTQASRPPERVRKSLDLAILSTLYQATLQLNGITIDTECLTLIQQLLLAFRTELENAGQVRTQLFLWQAFQPILPLPPTAQQMWPIAQRAGKFSGIRAELLPVHREEEENPGRARMEEFLVSAWRLPEVNDALRELITVARKLSDDNTTSSIQSNGTTYATQLPTQYAALDDDDFGEIRVAETDSMPVSKEALDSQRSTMLFLQNVVSFRLSGAKYQSQSLLPPRDANLLNSFLSAEGIRMIQLGRVVCDAVVNQQLQLSFQAIELILGTLEEFLSSYAYSRDEGLYLLVLSFLHCSASTWLADELAESEICERAINIAQHVVKRATSGNDKSWRVRLHVIAFLDEYCEYQPELELWRAHAKNDDVPAPTPPDALATLLGDQDLRVRVRAATSHPEVLYLPNMATHNHQNYYEVTLSDLSIDYDAFNFSITTTLWRLNCCIVSGFSRNAALFHLHEIRFFTPIYDTLLTRGLEVVAARLGLSSVQVLWNENVQLVGMGLLGSGFETIELPPSLSGFTDKKARAEAELASLAPALIVLDEGGGLTYLTKLCEEAGTTASEQILRHLYPAIARLLVKIASTGVDDTQIRSQLFEAISNIPGGKGKPKDAVTKGCTAIAVQVLDLVGPDYMDEGNVAMVSAIEAVQKLEGANADLLRMVSPDLGISFVEGYVPACHIIRALHFLEVKFPFDRFAVCYNALLHLFSRLDIVCSSAEQTRLLYQVGLTVAMYADTFSDGRILQLFILECVSLLDRPDIQSEVFSLVKWGFSMIPESDGGLTRLSDIIARLGRVRRIVNDTMGHQIDDWVQKEAAKWEKSDPIWGAIERSAILWPASMKDQLGVVIDPTFEDIADLVEIGIPSDSMTVCGRLSELIGTGKDVKENKRVFAEQSFWHIKNAYSVDTWTAAGAQAFVASLAEVDGQIDTPESHEEKIIKDLRTKLSKEPTSLAWVLFIRHLLRVVDRGDRPSRVGAYLVLRQLRPTMGDLIERSILPQTIRKEVELLQSPYPSELIITPVFSSDNLRDAVLTRVDQSEVWLRELAIRLCDITAREQDFFAQLRSFVASPTVDLAPLLPLLVQSCLSFVNRQDKKLIKERQTAIEAVFHASLRNPAVSDGVVHAILDTVLHLRSFKPPYRTDMLGYNHWLKLDFMLLSESAIKVGSFATALLFLEIGKRDDAESSDAEVDLSDGRLQKVMMAVYSNVNDPDGFYGIKINNVKESLRLRLNHEGEHLKAFGLHGADLEAATNGSGSTADLIASARDLHSIGIHRTALAITQSVRTRTDQVPIADDLLFDIAWRTGDWDLPVPPASTSAGAFYSALRSLHRSRDQESVQKTVDVAMKEEMRRLKDLGSERMTDIQNAVDNLLSLREVSLWLGPDVQRALAEGDYNSRELARFSEIGSSARYPLAERLHATKMSILSAAQSRESRNLIGDMSSPLGDALRNLQVKAKLGFSGYARAVGKVQASINAITSVQHIEGVNMSAATADEYGEVLWTQHEHSLALQLAEGLKADLDDRTKGARGRRGLLTGRIAYWSYRAKLLPVKEVSTMFHEAHAVMTNYRTSESELALLSRDYAVFAAEQQAAQRRTPTLNILRDYRDRRMKDVNALEEEERRIQDERKKVRLEMEGNTPRPIAKKGKGKGRASNSAAAVEDPAVSSKEVRDDENRAALKAEWKALISRDDTAITDAKHSIDTLTILSLKMFAHALRYSDEYDDFIMKMCTIWLEHCDGQDGTEEEMARASNIAKSFSTTLSDIPSHKFIPLAAQLAARLHQPAVYNTFNDQLNKTLLRVSQDHPYHTLYHIIPLAHGFKPQSKGATKDEGRSGAAFRLLQQLEGDTEHPLARSACQGMVKFSNIAIPFSLEPGPNKRTSGPGTRVDIQKGLEIRSLRDKLNIPVATCMPPVDPSRKYDKVPKILRYDGTYVLLGGVHRPKRVTAYDDAGQKHIQIFKGGDDIRQDAVMEQVFEMTNKMLVEDRQTATRKLRFRTYAVIPMAEQTGIIEFVAEGQSIGDWLKPAHNNYRANLDISTIAFRNELQSAQEEFVEEPDKVLAVWERLIPKFRPVMRHYFTEKHKDPMGWFAMRLRYSRSVAVTSIVGWMLGIGDRHLSNIMIDSKNGELIHIDFGHVFESGRNLRVPEKVPFRLTNDMVDGLGITGIEGTFRRCSEQTLRVLRVNSDLIFTLLEVLKHDPLYAWETYHEKIQRLHQGQNVIELSKSTVVLEKADRVLALIRDKLSDALSVEYTVNMVVQEARNPEFLATIYHGWQAWY